MQLEPRNVQALIFDLDGLLVDSEPTWFEVEGAFLARFGFEWTREEADACMGQGTPNTLRFWRDKHGIEIDLERDTESIVSDVIARAPQMPLKTGALDLLNTARSLGLPMAVASSSRTRLIRAVLASKGIESYFRLVVSGQDVARGKPAPDIFLRAAELLGARPSRCVVLEDALAGVHAGVAAGCLVFAVPSVHSPEFERCGARVVSSLLGVSAWLDAGSSLAPGGEQH
jgi:HAD superfamily hydrolase (TIGR01509 family)